MLLNNLLKELLSKTASKVENNVVPSNTVQQIYRDILSMRCLRFVFVIPLLTEDKRTGKNSYKDQIGLEVATKKIKK